MSGYSGRKPFDESLETFRLINRDARISAPSGWCVGLHRPSGLFWWEPERVSLFLAPEQLSGGQIEGWRLLSQFADNNWADASLFEHLQRHPALIPKEWRHDSEGNPQRLLFLATQFWPKDDDDPVLANCASTPFLIWNDAERCWDGGHVDLDVRLGCCDLALVVKRNH